MSHHKLIFLSFNSPHIGEMCPVRHKSFQPGDSVIVCQQYEAVISLESVSFMNGYCPICGNYIDIPLPSRPKSPESAPKSSPKKPSYPEPERGQSVAKWIIPLAAAILIAICFVGVGFGLFLIMRTGESTTIVSPSFKTVESTLASETTRVTPETVTLIPTDEPSAMPTQGTLAESPVFKTDSIGKSVRGRDIETAIIGYENETVIVVVGSIQGDQETTRELVDAVIRYYERNPEQIPHNALFYLVSSINPDGNASNSRYNANGVDLNRNWNTRDWKSNPAVPGYPDGKPGAGGSSPFSERETSALRDLLLSLQLQFSKVRVVVLHSSVRRSKGEVYPGGDQAMNIARSYADVTKYDIEYAWAEYVTSGEAITWCDEQGIPAIDIVIPASQNPSSQIYGGNTLLNITIQALEKVAISN